MQILKHIDFQAPAWGEFSQGPTQGSNAMLTQSGSASFPDRPALEGVGLDVVMSAGNEGSYLTHDLGAEQGVIHARLLVNPSGIGGGKVTLLAGLDGADIERLQIVVDVVNSNLTVLLAGGASLSSTLVGGLLWHCVEVSIDTVTDQAALWVNGILADQVSTDLSLSMIQAIRLGAVYKDAATTGSLYLDELVLADGYIGPVIVEPRESHAGDPARWLVVYNSADPDAGAWAEAYREARKIPLANLAGLALPVTELVSASEYADLVNAVEDYLTINRLDEQVMGILLGYRVPGYIDSVGGGMYEAVPAQMQTNSTSIGPALNTLASPTDYDRITAADLAGRRITARIDGADLDAATQLVARSTTIIDSQLAAEDSLFYFDPFVGDGAAYQAVFNDMIDWITGDGGMRTRLNIVLSGDPGGNDDADFDSVSLDGIYWGWSLTLPDPDVFTIPAGRRAVCGQVYLDGASATTLRNAAPGNWADTPLAAGYAAVIASSRNSPVFWIPDACALFEALTLGWTLAEAWFIAQPVIRGGFYLVGDPLMTIGMPHTGTEVFGPLASMKDLDAESPAIILTEGAREVDLADLAPVEGGQAIYVVRRTDALGRTDASPTAVRISHVGGQSLRPPALPVWPDVSGWAVIPEGGQIRLYACWDAPLAEMRVDSIELMGEPEGGVEAPVERPTVSPRDNNVVVIQPVPGTRTRYRWRVTSPDGVVMHTEWSGYVDPPAQPTGQLQQIGAGS